MNIGSCSRLLIYAIRVGKRWPGNTRVSTIVKVFGLSPIAAQAEVKAPDGDLIPSGMPVVQAQSWPAASVPLPGRRLWSRVSSPSSLFSIRFRYAILVLLDCMWVFSADVSTRNPLTGSASKSLKHFRAANPLFFNVPIAASQPRTRRSEPSCALLPAACLF